MPNTLSTKKDRLLIFETNSRIDGHISDKLLSDLKRCTAVAFTMAQTETASEPLRFMKFLCTFKTILQLKEGRLSLFGSIFIFCFLLKSIVPYLFLLICASGFREITYAKKNTQFTKRLHLLEIRLLNGKEKRPFVSLH